MVTALLLAAAAVPPGPVLVRHTLSFDLARATANAALQTCRDRGYHVAVAVTDRDGVLQILERDDEGGVHLLDAARRKAFTAASSSAPTSDWEKSVDARSGVPDPHIAAVKDVLVVGGGVPIRIGSETIGAIGVAGSPGVQFDEECALAGIDAIKTALRTDYR